MSHLKPSAVKRMGVKLMGSAVAFPESGSLLNDEEQNSDLGLKAARIALEKAGLRIEDIDLIVYATSSPEHSMPSTACVLSDKLEAGKTGAMDIQSGGNGFFYALDLATQYLQTGWAQRILLVAGDAMSRLISEDDPLRDRIKDSASAWVIEKGDWCWKMQAGIIPESRDIMRMPFGGTSKSFKLEDIKEEKASLRFHEDGFRSACLETLKPRFKELLQELEKYSESESVFFSNSFGGDWGRFLFDDQQKAWLEFANPNGDRWSLTTSFPLWYQQQLELGVDLTQKRLIVASVGAGLNWVLGTFQKS
jgi:hypothetical protein